MPNLGFAFVVSIFSSASSAIFLRIIHFEQIPNSDRAQATSTPSPDSMNTPEAKSAVTEGFGGVV
jgi:hypothetical protein